MRSVFRYIRDYVSGLDKRVLAITTVFTALLVFINYHFHLDDRIDELDRVPLFLARYAVFVLAFLGPYIFYSLLARKNYFRITPFVVLGLVAPSFFALKTAISVHLPFASDAAFWNKVVYWPVLLIIMLTLLVFTRKVTGETGSFYGLTSKNLVWKPYLLMLLIMVPLIALASTQPDFLHTYPKLQNLEGVDRLADIPWWKKVLFELSYGSDFISIEVFFRGFLIIAFVKWAGKDAILPMACFYCTIHFGKPLGECISSYFGGILLGILVYNTRSVLGGLMVHLGIAWMMEIGGYLGNGLS
ncbi:MAG: abortive infection protein [Chitinophagaceae bacterium]|nr:MAG: abortive infection protein [Chitinophagaceae bacterium]